MVPQSVEGKVALITGVNKGIGFETARQLGRQGMTVLVGARHAGREREAHQGTHSVEQGARAAVRLAMLPTDGPTGGFFNADGPLPW